MLLLLYYMSEQYVHFLPHFFFELVEKFPLCIKVFLMTRAILEPQI